MSQIDSHNIVKADWNVSLPCEGNAPLCEPYSEERLQQEQRKQALHQSPQVLRLAQLRSLPNEQLGGIELGIGWILNKNVETQTSQVHLARPVLYEGEDWETSSEDLEREEG